MLVGDIIQAIREAITDQSQTLGAPGTSAGSVVSQANSFLAAGNYYLTATLLTTWGETNRSAELGPFTIGASQGIQLTVNGWPGIPSSCRVYISIGGVPGSENSYVTAIIPVVSTGAGSVTLTVGDPAFAVYTSMPPIKSNAYLPDTDGDAVSANTMFRWLNDALKRASAICEGLLDYGGLSTTSGVSQYIAPGEWRRISTLWYDGYPLAMDDAGNYFRRNPITASILASVATSLFTDRMMLEVWPQPSRTAAGTTLASPLAATDTQAILTSSGGFLLTNGFVKIGNELMSYSSIQGNTLKNLIRGLGGSRAVAASAGASVNELNMFWQGWRMYEPTFAPGDSLLTIPVPVGWESVIPIYGLARMKLAEQNVQEYQALLKNFEETLQKWFNSNRVTTGPRQLGEQTSSLQTLPSFGGGWVVP